MKLSLPVLLTAFGLLAGGGGGSYWYLVQAGTDPGAHPPAHVRGSFVDMDRKFVVPVVRGNRVRSLVVAELRLEVKEASEQRARELKPRLRDALLETLFSLAVAGVFDGDMYSNNVQDEMRARLLQSARGVLQEDVLAVLIGELIRQDQ